MSEHNILSTEHKNNAVRAYIAAQQRQNSGHKMPNFVLLERFWKVFFTVIYFPQGTNHSAMLPQDKKRSLG